MRRVILKEEQVWRGPLILVNAAHALRPGRSLRLAPVDERYPDVRIDRQAARLLADCIRQVHGDGAIIPVSGWRSQAEQQQIWDESLAAHGKHFTHSYVALPGCSEHQTGLAIDLGQAASKIDFIRPAFPDYGVCGAFRRRAADYGFICRYERDKQSLTGIAAEPWHFRYVGLPHARLMTERNLCLEEYIDLLRRQELSCLLPGGWMAQVFFVPCRGAETEAELPDGCCQVSGNNVDGFVITAWGVLA